MRRYIVVFFFFFLLPICVLGVTDQELEHLDSIGKKLINKYYQVINTDLYPDFVFVMMDEGKEGFEYVDNNKLYGAEDFDKLVIYAIEKRYFDENNLDQKLNINQKVRREVLQSLKVVRLVYNFWFMEVLQKDNPIKEKKYILQPKYIENTKIFKLEQVNYIEVNEDGSIKENKTKDSTTIKLNVFLYVIIPIVIIAGIIIINLINSIFKKKK